MKGKTAKWVVWDEITPSPIPQADWDKLDYCIEAMRRIKAESGASRAWNQRLEVLETSRSFKRFLWIRWVERQAAMPKGQQWCKDLVTKMITIKLEQA